jgi:hypothetical protein
VSFPLTVDPRAGSKNLIPVLRSLGINVAVEPMEFGDVAFAGNGPDGVVTVGFEHKTLDDVLKCIVDGRFAAHQLPGMQACYDVRWLVIQGEWTASDGGELLIRKGRKWKTVPGQNRKVWFYSAVEHWIETMRTEGGFHVHYPPDLRRAALFIKARYTWWQREWTSHDSLHAFNTSMIHVVQRPGITKRMAACVPGVGWELSGRVAKHFGTPKEMVNAPASEWMKVEKIGPTIAKRAVWLMENGRERE